MKKASIITLVVALILSIGATTFAAPGEVTTPGTGSSELQVTIEATTFSVTVPMNLSINVDSAGNVTPATGAKIINNSYGAVKVTGVAITPEAGWTIVSFSDDMTVEKVGTKKLGFKLNNGVTVGSVLGFNAVDYPKIDGKKGGPAKELALTYDAVVPAQHTAITPGTKVASVVFTIGWDQ